MMRCLFILATVIASQIISAQPSTEKECLLAMDIPSRLLVISADEKEIVYRDRKTNSILTFTKAGLTNYDFNLDFTAENVVNELSEDPGYSRIQQEKYKMSYSDVVMINWTRDRIIPNRRNNHNAIAMMDVCGQYYTFRFRMPSSKEPEMMPVFMEILDSIEIVE